MKQARFYGGIFVALIGFVSALVGIFAFARDEVEARVSFTIMQSPAYRELTSFDFHQFSGAVSTPMPAERYERLVREARREVWPLSLCIMTCLCRASKLDEPSCYDTIQTYKSAFNIHSRDPEKYPSHPGFFWRRLALNCDTAKSGQPFLMQRY